MCVGVCASRTVGRGALGSQIVPIPGQTGGIGERRVEGMGEMRGSVHSENYVTSPTPSSYPHPLAHTHTTTPLNGMAGSWIACSTASENFLI